MINISRLGSGALLLQRDDTEIVIDASAVQSALGPIIVSLVDCGRAAGEARRAGYEAGLAQGRMQARIEHETSLRIAARQAEELIEALAGVGLAQAA